MRDFVAVRRYLWANQTLSAGFAKIINPSDEKGISQNASEGNKSRSKQLRIAYCYEVPNRDFVAVRRHLWANQTLSAGFAKIINPGDDKGIFQNASEGNDGHSKRLRIVYCYESPMRRQFADLKGYKDVLCEGIQGKIFIQGQLSDLFQPRAISLASPSSVKK